ncbi:hypothetical protein DFJ74DRAFT_646209 [Hyaloraphidium curvatum]|nr:hypothetical protein DFJ74DRAFT_646209 [Hyaloraphidium curvatum]
MSDTAPDGEGAETVGQQAPSYSPWKPGDMVWGKLKGFPVEKFEDVSDAALKEKRKKDSIPVLWCETWDYGWFTPAELKPYAEHKAEFTKKSDKKLRSALEYADNPEKIEEELAQKRQQWEAKKRKAEEKEIEAARKRQKKAEKKAGGKDGSSDEDDEAKAEKKRLKKEKKEEKKRKKEERRSGEEQGSSKKSKGKSDESRALAEVPMSKTDPVMKCRIKLQKYLTENLEDEETAKKASEVLNDVETGNFSMEKLQETKLAKVIKKLAAKDIKSDVYKLVARSEALVHKWRDATAGESTPTTGKGPAAETPLEADAPSSSGDAVKAEAVAGDGASAADGAADPAPPPEPAADATEEAEPAAEPMKVDSKADDAVAQDGKADDAKAGDAEAVDSKPAEAQPDDAGEGGAADA